MNRLQKVFYKNSYLIACFSVVMFSALIFGGAYLYFLKKAKPQPEVKVEITEIAPKEQTKKEYIKWAQFDATYEMLNKAYKYDVKSGGKIKWYELLAYSVAKNWGNVSNKKCLAYIDKCADELNSNKTMADIAYGLEYYPFYREVYKAVLGQYLGTKPDGSYGMLVYSPIAAGHYYSHYDDFGASRSYGFARTHKGNDLLGSVGTPIIAVEDGTIEAMGWNMYGGWRIGIRSPDKKRYYYYAHLRKNHPFNNTFKEGDKVKAGDVIGYLGMTGYSTKENVNNITTPHLHFGLELVFDESQKESSNEIWVNVYNIVKFLYKNRSEVHFDEINKEYFKNTQ